MSDISKSNDSEELERFYPSLHHTILQHYIENPFPFKYGEYSNLQAFRFFVDFSEDTWTRKLYEGFFSNFVTCFSEKKDCLSQWRGYADNGNGCCIGFSKSVFEAYCKVTKNVIQLQKVEYLSKEGFNQLLNRLACSIISQLKSFYEILSHTTDSQSDDEIEDELFFCFNKLIEEAFTESLKYKSNDFSEENEWRIFFTDQGYKMPEFVYGNKEGINAPDLFGETLDFLNNKIDFRWTENDLIPFVPLAFSEFSECPITELWMGPKNRIRESDIKLFLKKHGYEKVKVFFSEISYR